MKKLLLVAAFAGMLGSTAFAGTNGDDKKDKKDSKKTEKACAGEKTCAKGEKSCCKKKAEASATADTKSTTKK
jgi:hypothetical protein